MPPATDTAPETKRLVLKFEVKDVSAKERTFEGMLSTWDLDFGGDVVHRGAFKRTLSHWKSSGRVIPLIDNHAYKYGYHSIRQVVGKMLEAKETQDGLPTKWDVIGGPDGDEVLRRVEGDYVTGLSIGYRAVKAEPATEDEQKRGIFRHLKELELREGSITMWPMNDLTHADPGSVKSLIDAAREGTLTDEEKEELRALLEAPPAPADEPKGLAPEQQAALSQRILALRIHRLATRDPAARHSGTVAR